MTQPGSILGNPPPAPLAAGPSQEDRLLAAAAYLGYFTGFWLVVPIVIYVLKREKSRFVAHHALRAVVLHLVAVPVFVASWILGIGVAFGMALLIQDLPRRSQDAAGMGVALLSIVGWVIPWVVYLLVCVVGAIRGFQGRMSSRSLLGRLVEWMLGQDRTVAPPSPSEIGAPEGSGAP